MRLCVRNVCCILTDIPRPVKFSSRQVHRSNICACAPTTCRVSCSGRPCAPGQDEPAESAKVRICACLCLRLRLHVECVSFALDRAYICASFARVCVCKKKTRPFLCVLSPRFLPAKEGLTPIASRREQTSWPGCHSHSSGAWSPSALSVTCMNIQVLYFI